MRTSLPLLLLLLMACDRGYSDPRREWGPPAPEGPLHPVELHIPSTLGVVDTPLVDVNGTPIGVACETCHGASAAGPWADRAGGEPFHAALSLEHGPLSCSSCHDPEDRSQLRLADGQTLEMADALQLCAQCHGPQTRDYRRGSHGGMSGHWDLRRGPRERNHCLDCHAPHSPAIRPVSPAPAPRDRRPDAHED